jgi:addiction module HigA family antidote
MAKKMGKSGQLMPPVHPGEILREDFMKPLGLSVNKLALELHVPATRIGEIVHERRRITAETALRLARGAEKRKASKPQDAALKGRRYERQGKKKRKMPP